MTVADIVAALLKLPQDAPALRPTPGGYVEITRVGPVRIPAAAAEGVETASWSPTGASAARIAVAFDFHPADIV